MLRVLLIFAFVWAGCQQAVQKESGVLARNGMVSTAHPEASKIGVVILQQGGNAFDAAIAVQFALAVCYPVAGNIGGGGFAVIRKANGDVDALDFREKAPKAATQTMYLDEKGEVIPQSSLLGHLSVGVPGSVDGMVRLHEKYGRLAWEQLVQPSIDLADRGFVLCEWDAGRLNADRGNFLKVNRNPSLIVKEGGWKAGDTLKLPDLARTLERIRDHRRRGFYEGETARLLLAEIQRGKGILTQQDLDSYRAVWRKPLVGQYRGHRIITMPLPSSGGVTLLQMLQATEKYPLHTWGHLSAKHLHLLTELARRAYADRFVFLGDADFVSVPLDSLLSESYISNRFADIALDKKTDSQAIRQGNAARIESYETTHFSVVDKERNAVAITTTINGYFGSKVMVEGAGFFLNNEMDDFSIKVGHPNQFGIVGSEANAIAPEKRMLSSMTPTIVEKNGDLWMVVGTPGGSTIITGVYQVIVNVIDFQMTMQAAIDAPRIHAQWLPDILTIEEGTLADTTVSELKRLGHHVHTIPKLGMMNNILLREDGLLEGAADRRGIGNAVGY